jgi:hypothetical protein
MVAPRAHHLFRARYLGPGTRGFLFASARGGLACPVLLQNAECMRGPCRGPRKQPAPPRDPTMAGLFYALAPTFGIGCRRADWSQGPPFLNSSCVFGRGFFHGLLACPMWLLSVTESYKLNLFSFDGKTASIGIQLGVGAGRDHEMHLDGLLDWAGNRSDDRGVPCRVDHRRNAQGR